MKPSLSNARGFSLIETMVAVAIIGVLATIGAVDFTKFAVRAKYMRARSEMAGLSTIVSGLRITEEKFMWGITGNGCSECSGMPLQTWISLGYTEPLLDPWGQPYHIDENNGETAPVNCRNDCMWSGGADSIYSGVGDGVSVYNDDLMFRIPYWFPVPGCPVLPLTQVGPTYNH